jgi:hypothetical protein
MSVKFAAHRTQPRIAMPSYVDRVSFGTTTNPHLHVDQVLTNVVLGYTPEARIWDRIAPVVPVGKQSDFYLEYSRADILRREEAHRAPGVEARVISKSIGSGTYFALNYALKMQQTVEDQANADPAFRQNFLNQDAMHLVDLLDLDIEARMATLITTVANVGSGAGISSAWSAGATTGNSDPIGDINSAIDIVHDNTGKRPNKMTLGHQAWRSLRRHVDIRNLIYGTNNGGGYPNTAQVAELFELDEVLVGGTYENTGDEAQTESLSPIWADHVVIHRTPSAPSRMEPSAFYSFRWAANGLANMQVERHPFDSRTKSSEIEVGYYQDEVVTGATYAYVIRAVNSAT